MAIKFTNNASSKLTQALTTSATSMYIKAEDVSKFPVLGSGDYCLLTIVGDNGNHEIVKVTNISSDGICTIERAQDSTTAKEWPVDNRVELRITAEYLNSTTTSEDVLSFVSPIEEDISNIKNNITNVENDILNIESDISSLSSKQEEIINTTIPSLPDNVTISFEGDKLQVKDIAIGGDSSDLASNRGIFNAKALSAVDLNSLINQGFYTVPHTGSTNSPGFASKLFIYRAANSTYVLQVAFGNDTSKLATRYSSDNGGTWSNWTYYINDNTIGDGIKVNNGIISVPEYEGATDSTASISGLVPPATSAERNNFLRGDGTWQQVDLSDYALKTELTKYLPLTGGTITGNLAASSIFCNRPSSSVTFGVGTSCNTGSSLSLYGKDSSSGIMNGFQLRAGQDSASLSGYPSGQLTWQGKNLVRSVGGATADSSGNVTAPYLPLTGGTITGSLRSSYNNKLSGIIQSDAHSYFVNTINDSGTNGGSIVLRNEHYTYGPNSVEFYTGESFTGPAFYLQQNGNCIWNGKHVVRSVNGVNADSSGNVTLTTGMPVGSIYVQFSGQSAPSDLFGGTWSNISNSYARFFFRAEGGRAAAFGSSQGDSAPEISGSVSILCSNRGVAGSGVFKGSKAGGATRPQQDIGYPGDTFINFNASDSNDTYGAADEVRPVNSTVRIWKRTA